MATRFRRYFDAVETSPVLENVDNKKTLGDIKKMKKVCTPEDKVKRAALKKQKAKKKQEKKRRIIIRNLSFKINEKELKNILSKFGTVTDLKIPTKPDGKKRGFAFAQFEKFQSTMQAIKQLNYKELHGRPIAIDYALPKNKYEEVNSSKSAGNDDSSINDKSVEMDSDSETDSSDKNDDALSNDAGDADEENKADEKDFENEEDKRVNKFLKEFEFNVDSDDEGKDDVNESSSEASDDENDNSASEDEQEKQSAQSSKSHSFKTKAELSESKKKIPDDVQEGKTVFIRNISFDTNQETFREAMEDFGPVKYCLLCIDPVTELPRGTAFVKFENKDDADKLIKKADQSGTGVFLDNRRLYCVPALSREEMKKKSASDMKEKKDKRNFRLLREGLIMPNSEEAKGVSQTDLAKRAKLEAMKKQKLKNLNFFVSDTRLCVHNLPPEYTDKQLRQLFKGAAPKGAVVIEAKVMREMSKIGASGEAKSKGFGFVSFSVHEHALEALHKLNNNPAVFSAQKRPIVEFSVESHLALLSKQRRREKNRLQNKRKAEQAQVEKSDAEQAQQPMKVQTVRNKKRKRKTEKGNIIKKPHIVKSPQPSSGVSDSKKAKNKKGSKKKGAKNKVDYKSLTNMIDHYKSKLLNKLQ